MRVYHKDKVSLLPSITVVSPLGVGARAWNIDVNGSEFDSRLQQ